MGNETIIHEWMNEHVGMGWQKIKAVRIIDENRIVVGGWNEITDTRSDK